MLRESPTIQLAADPVDRRLTSGIRAEVLVDARDFGPGCSRISPRPIRASTSKPLPLRGRGGLEVASAVMRSVAPDRRVLIDAYTRHKISDRLIHTLASRLDRGFQAEVAATRNMVEALRSAGCGVKFTNPVDRLLLRFPARNHKKLVVVDGVCYIGGINFSDHNFAWHDFMLRIDDKRIADRLALDFQIPGKATTGAGWSRSMDWTVGVSMVSRIWRTFRSCSMLWPRPRRRS